MGDLTALINILMEVYKLNFKVFGYNLNFLTVFIGIFLIGLAVYAVRKLFF